MSSKSGTEKFQFLAKLALDSGAADAKIIPTHKVVVEDRVVLKCKVGCNHYGKTLACPPYTPTAEQFRKIVSEYSYAMFMKFTTNATADPDVYKYLMTYETDPKRKMLQSVVNLEKAAMKEGYSLAISFVSGHCQLCEKCETETGICRHPELMRISEDAIGVNVKKTAANAGIAFNFPFTKSADSFALLLID
jgi:predicted metal-binding protein